MYSLSDEEFKELIANSKTYSECLRSLGLTTNGGCSLDRLKKRINELHCDTSHFDAYYTIKYTAKTTYPLEKILVLDSPYKGTNECLKKGLFEKDCWNINVRFAD